MTDRNVDKKELILKTAMQLFAEKGSSSTSMQEIAELCGISKGSLYLVFKSKEELERSLYIYCFRMIRDPLLREEQESRGTPREKLRNQIEILLSHVYELREFLKRQLQEFAGSNRTDVPEWMCKNNVPSLIKWLQVKLEMLYGKEILPFTGDLCLVVHGLLSSYIHTLFHPGTPVHTTRMADHFIDLMDIIVAGLLNRQPEPLISPDIISDWIKDSASLRKNPQQLLKEMRTMLSASDSIDPRRLQDALDSLTILEDEFLVLRPRRAIVLGMLANLQTFPEVADNLEELNRFLLPYM